MGHSDEVLKDMLREGFVGKRTMKQYQQCGLAAERLVGREDSETFRKVRTLCMVSPEKLKVDK